jgi:hypothetical protein
VDTAATAHCSSPGLSRQTRDHRDNAEADERGQVAQAKRKERDSAEPMRATYRHRLDLGA